MKYKYYDKGKAESGKLIAESDSPIQFNVARFAIWKGIKPVIEEEKKVTKKKEATAEVAGDEDVKDTSYKSKKKKTQEDNQ